MSPEIHSGGTTSFQLLKPLWAEPERENSKQEQPSVGFWSGRVGQGMLRCRQAWHVPLPKLLTLTGLLFVAPPQLYLWAGKVGAHPSSISELARLVLGQHETLLWGDLLPVLVVWWERANGRAVSALPAATSWCLSQLRGEHAAPWQFWHEVVAHYIPGGFKPGRQ